MQDQVRHHNSSYPGEGVCGHHSTNSLILQYLRCMGRQEQIPDRSMETEFAPAFSEENKDKQNLGANIPFCSILAMLRNPWCLDTEVQKTRPLANQLS